MNPKQLVQMSLAMDRINQFCRHVDLCAQCKIGKPYCETGQKLKEEMEK